MLDERRLTILHTLGTSGYFQVTPRIVEDEIYFHEPHHLEHVHLRFTPDHKLKFVWANTNDPEIVDFYKKLVKKINKGD